MLEYAHLLIGIMLNYINGANVGKYSSTMDPLGLLMMVNFMINIIYTIKTWGFP